MSAAPLILMHGLLMLLAIPAVLACGYLLTLTLLSRRSTLPVASTRTLRFDIIVPAHNEAAGIERVVANLQRLDWPRDRFRIVVVADNCSDATAALARGAGAEVIERSDIDKRGKGYALQLAFAQSAALHWANAVVVVDADSAATSNLLEAFAARIESGANAIQAHYGVLNPHLSWRTRLMTIALAAFHIVRSRARERLRVSSGIRGNGWCVTHRLLARMPYAAFSLAEDIEFGVEIGLAGYRVHYADEATVRGEMVGNASAAAQQRRRWEGGRLQLIRSHLWPLLRTLAAQASDQRISRALVIDLMADLLVLPLSSIALNVATLMIAALIASWFAPTAIVWFWLSCGCAFAIALYVLRGWRLSGIGKRGLLDLLHAPGFIIWKTILLLKTRAPLEWVRTKRESL